MHLLSEVVVVGEGVYSGTDAHNDIKFTDNY